MSDHGCKNRRLRVGIENDPYQCPGCGEEKIADDHRRGYYQYL